MIYPEARACLSPGGIQLPCRGGKGLLEPDHRWLATYPKPPVSKGYVLNGHGYEISVTALMRTILTVILVAAPLTLFAAGGASQDKALLTARDAFLAGDGTKLARQAEKVRGHVLEPYVGYWRLRLRLDEADPAELRDFLARNAGTVLAEQLRRDWLRLLGKNGQWELFRQEHPALVRDDPDVACYALQARWLSQDESVPAGDQTLLEDAAGAARGVRGAGGRDAALR